MVVRGLSEITCVGRWLALTFLGRRILTFRGSVGNESMVFTGRSAITLHIYGNKCIMKAIEMTLSLSSHRLDLERARKGFKS